MNSSKKTQEEILNKLEIEKLNSMQINASEAISSNSEVVLLSPTGTGKTLAFLLPIIAKLNSSTKYVQALIVVPSRELAIQIEQIVREMGSGFKINAVFGGRSGSKDKVELKQPPAILVGTPGRVSDHLYNGVIETKEIKMLVLDEFDKSLEVGFEDDMKVIIDALPLLEKKILTSATQKVKIPPFMKIMSPKKLNYLNNSAPLLKLKTVISPNNRKLETLEKILNHVGDEKGIIFCNYKNSIQLVSEFLDKKDIGHSSFFGGLEQVDRERALIMFRNGTYRILLATDLAARGIDVPELNFIIHFELPPRKDEFIHRNGRTARMNNNGVAYVIKEEKEELPVFIIDSEIENIKPSVKKTKTNWQTLYISGGRRDKISKGDIAGLFFKKGNLKPDELGNIELKQDCSFVAVPRSKAQYLINQLNNQRIKKRKVRVSLLEKNNVM